MKSYSQAPLPFMGQKRRFAGEFKKALTEFSDHTLFIDLFGGSGLLSHIVKQNRPDARVIYNDFDDYHLRLANVEQTNRLLADLRTICKDAPKDKKLNEEVKHLVLERIKKETGFVDYITLSSSLLFSMNYVTTFAELEKQTMYNCIRTSGYECTGYLDGIEVVKYDYKELFNIYRNYPNVVFLVDPPYLSTEVGVYKSYWKLGSYLDVLQTIQGVSYFYFTSNKSQIIELCDWTERNLKADNPFKGATRKDMHSTVNYSSKYIDIMLYKRK